MWAPGAPEGALGLFLGGASLFDASSRRAYVLIDEGGYRSLGPIMAWARQRGAATIDVLVEDPDVAGVLARRAALFASPPKVWLIQGREVAPAHPAAVELPAPAPPDAAAFAAVLRDHGIEPVLEHGVLLGEILGLEVARVVEDEDGGYRLAVGVGRLDRLARQQLDLARWGGRITDIGAALDEAAALVRKWRVPNVPAHPANRLARPRWLRAALMSRPDLVGAAHLWPLSPPITRGSLLESTPAAAVGTDQSGGTVVVACSTGIDLDLVPEAADSTLMAPALGYDEPARLALVVPAVDNHRVTRDLAAALKRPAEIVPAPADWESLGP
jgi:hypothetical protein